MRRFFCLLILIVLTCSVPALAEDDFLLGVAPEATSVTPAYRSEWTLEDHENCRGEGH